MRIFENLNINFLGKRRIFYVVSVSLFLLGFLNIVFRGLEFGIDFKGGSEIVLQFENPVDIADVRNKVQDLGLGELELKTFGGETGVLIRSELQNIPSELFPKVVANIQEVIENKMPGLPRSILDTTASSVTFQLPNADTTAILVNTLFAAGFQASRTAEEDKDNLMIIRVGISDWIKDNLREKITDNPFIVIKEDRVGPKVGNELKRDALVAILLSLVAILIYLGFRFKFIFALGAVVALFHDVLITLGLYSVLYGLIPGLNLDITLTVVAAFLTLIGYSINDTVIVFDRVRENLKIHKTVPLEENMNNSINKTMSRTILTTLTTLITVTAILIFGGEVLRSFAFTLAFGILIGTYSSIFVASALVLEYASRTKKKLQF